MLALGPKFPNVFEHETDKGKSLYTKSILPGVKHFGEYIFVEGTEEYRFWDPFKSKLAAALAKRLAQCGIKEGDKVLYLGASHGYTPSFISDIIGKKGFMFCLDSAPRVIRDLLFVTELRANMTPILADANQPKSYQHLLCRVDILYQDVAQKNQVEIFLKNADAYLRGGGFGLLAIKARSMDVTKNPRVIFKEAMLQLEEHHLTVVDHRLLDPFEKDHAFFVVKKK
ncbi:MAG: fibrillarin-like rRNA/tRNA 2'-O-methyltransferase [Nanoarchaeota archaeon]